MKTILTSASIALVLSASLAATSLPAAADRGVGGDETNADRVVPSANAWTILTAEPFQTMNDITHCVATGSADAQNPNMGNSNLYRFTLSIDTINPAVDGACERTVAFDGGITRIEEVSSTCAFRNLSTGNHTIYWLARKVAAGAPNLTVTDNSMTFVCLNNLLDSDGEGDGGPD